MTAIIDSELNQYLDERITYCVSRLMQTGYFPEEARDDLAAELRLVALQSQRAYDPRLSSPKTYFSRKIEFRASNLLHRQRTECAHILFVSPGDMPEQVATLEGDSLGCLDSTQMYLDITGSVDERLASDVAAAWLSPELHELYDLLRDGLDRMTICRLLGVTASTLSRRITHLHSYLRTCGLDLPASAFPRGMRRRMLTTIAR